MSHWKTTFRNAFMVLILFSSLAVRTQTQFACFHLTVSPQAAGSNPRAICAADFNLDGSADIAIANASSNNVSILLANSGGFASAVNYTAGAGPESITTGDFNSDGKTDIAVVNYAGNNISVLIGSGTGTFSVPTNFSVGSGPNSICAGDFNADNKIDLAITNANTNDLSVLFGNGTGSFTASLTFSCGLQPFCVRTADFNSDGKLDLVTANSNGNNASVLMGTGTGSFLPPINYAVGTQPYQLTVADFNSDNNKDIAVANDVSGNLSILLGSPTGTFASAVNYTSGLNPFSIISGDFNLDGKLDIATADFGSNQMSIFIGSGTGTFAAAVHYTAGTNPAGVISADFNGDGKTDLAVSDYGTNTAHIYLNGVPQLSVSPSNTVCANNSITIAATGTGVATYSWSTGVSNNSIVVTPSATTIYTVAGTSSGGCINFAVKTISASPLPTITMNTGSICAGQQYIFIPAGASNYTISGNSFTVNPVSTTQYSVIGSSSVGCASSSAVAVTLTVQPLPTITVNSGTICNGQSFTVQPSGALSYSVTGNNFTVSPLANTSYSITGTSSAGCISSSAAVSSVTVYALPAITVNSGSICSGTSFTILPGGASTYSVTGNTMTVSPLSTTNYSVTGTSSTGCVSQSPAISSVVVYSLPAVSVNNGSVCSGQSFAIVPSGAVTYTITGNAFTVTPAVSATYSVTGTSSDGCISSNPAVSSVTVYTLPVISVNSGSICSGSIFTITPSGAAFYTISGGSYTVSPPLTTSYQVTGVSLQGCSSSNTAVAVVSVSATPVISVNSGSICAGQTFTIMATGADNFIYAGGSQTVNPFSNTSYTVVGQNNSGCLSSNTGTASVTVFNLPQVFASSSSTNLCSGEAITLTGFGASTYTWSGGVVNNVAFSPTANDVYTVTGTDANGCKNTFTVSVNVNPCTGISETEAVLDFIIYPNPAKEVFFIGSTLLNAEIEVYSLTGQKILEKMISGDEEQIDLGSHPNGIYQLLIMDNKKIIKKVKIVKE
jgi:hypothetical protein